MPSHGSCSSRLTATVLFLTKAHARYIIESWRIGYNSERPHSSLGNRTKQEFAEISLAKQKERVSLSAHSSRNSD